MSAILPSIGLECVHQHYEFSKFEKIAKSDIKCVGKCLEINISDTHCPLGAAEGLHILTESLKS